MGRRRTSPAAGLGRALLRERGRHRGGRRAADGWLHVSECGEAEGAAPGRDLHSVTEESALEAFLSTAQLKGTHFAAEKLNVRLIPAENRTGLPSAQEARRLQSLQDQNRRLLRVPRRPTWDKQTSPEVLSQAERDTFLEWRRQLAKLEEEQNLLLTPFERNLEFWRQLWRVLERSDIVVQIVDARNPLLFRCPDLESYVKELNPVKENLLLLNKADLLSEEQRSAWARFFEGEGVRVVFWSALEEGMRLSAALQEMKAVNQPDPSQEELEAALRSGGNRVGSPSWLHGNEEHDSSQEEDSDVNKDCDEGAWLTCPEDEAGGAGPLQETGVCDAELHGTGLDPDRPIRNSSCLVSRDELLEILKALHTGKTVHEGEVTVGLVGYPNVGKSSTINTILGKKKVSVSVTPGHTKHFQTLYVESGLRLCDCPGLVMPSFVSTKAEMTCSGILPIDQLRDHIPPISLICQRIPRRVLEETYRIHIERPREDEAPDRPPTAEELLTAYGCVRGFRTDHGRVDQSRSARCLLKDYVQGKLLFCHSPPGVDPEDFQRRPERNSPRTTPTPESPKEGRRRSALDEAFFCQEEVRVLTRGVRAPLGSGAALREGSAGKPWKRHCNRNKKEKLRRRTSPAGLTRNCATAERSLRGEAAVPLLKRATEGSGRGGGDCAAPQ